MIIIRKKFTDEESFADLNNLPSMEDMMNEDNENKQGNEADASKEEEAEGTEKKESKEENPYDYKVVKEKYKSVRKTVDPTENLINPKYKGDYRLKVEQWTQQGRILIKITCYSIFVLCAVNIFFDVFYKLSCWGIFGTCFILVGGLLMFYGPNIKIKNYGRITIICFCILQIFISLLMLIVVEKQSYLIGGAVSKAATILYKLYGVNILYSIILGTMLLFSKKIKAYLDKL